MDCKPLSTSCGETSRTVTWHPAFAATCAIPDPISPHPTTPTFSIAIYSSRIIVVRYICRATLRTAFLCKRKNRSRIGSEPRGNQLRRQPVCRKPLCRQPRRLASRVHFRENFLRDMKRGIRRRHSAIDRSLKQNFLNLLAGHVIICGRANVHPKLVVAV